MLLSSRILFKKLSYGPYHLSLTCQLLVIDRFDTKLTDGLFDIFDGIKWWSSFYLLIYYIR